MKVKCHLVKLKELVSISAKCYKATDFSGNTALIPKSQVFPLMKWGSDSVYISAWILKQKELIYSNAEYWVEKSTGKAELSIEDKKKKREKGKLHETVEVHVPEYIAPINTQIHEDLLK